MVCADTGIGMSEEFQKHVFEAFVQEDTSARTTYSGIGLGPVSYTHLIIDQGREHIEED